MEDDNYRYDLRNHFISQLKSAKFESSTKANKDTEQPYSKRQAFDPGYPSQRGQQKKNQTCAASNGGDADRAFCESSYHSQNTAAWYCRDDSIYPVQPKSTSIPTDATTKYKPQERPCYMYDTDSNIDGAGDSVAGSSKSFKSSKTVISKKSSKDLQNAVKSQCKMQNAIDESITGMTERIKTNSSRVAGNYTNEQQCKYCHKIRGPGIQKDGMTQIKNEDAARGRENRNADNLEVNVEDVVNSKVIIPMICKLQGMYLNNLKEEMSLIEDLGRLPQKINEVYKVTVFKHSK